jgi:hypothetical protein
MDEQELETQQTLLWKLQQATLIADSYPTAEK